MALLIELQGDGRDPREDGRWAAISESTRALVLNGA